MAMAHSSIFASIFMLSCLAASSYADGSFSALQRSLIVTASPQPGQVLHAGKDEITVTWSLNTTFAGTDSTYRTVKVKLCYALISQKDRGWRKTEDELSKDKTCQHKVVARPYSASNNTFTATVLKDVPTATYFLRAYVYDSADNEVAFGDTTDVRKTTNLFNIEGISGRHTSLDIASGCFSAFAIASLIGFFMLEKRNAKASANK